MVRLFEGAMQNKKYIAKSIALALGFWLVQFAYQHYFLAADAQTSLIRSAALTGATLIAAALLVGPLGRLSRWNYIVHRRTLGVLGFTFAIVHALAVVVYALNYDVFLIFANLNPFEMPIVFGAIAFIIYIPLYLTSTDWANAKLTYRKWKAIHRLVYFAFIANVLHFTLINPLALFQPFGYLLLVVTALVFITEICAFIKYTTARKGKGRYVGIFIMLFGAALFATAYSYSRSVILAYLVAAVIVGVVVLQIYMKLKLGKKVEANESIGH